MAYDALDAQRYDQGMRFLEKTGISGLRRRLVSNVAGEVLEIGSGTGANIGAYQRDVRVTAIDLRENFLRSSALKARESGWNDAYAVARADARYLPFEDSAFDFVVGSLVFCSIAEPLIALQEIRRVLRPNGRLQLLEHVRGQTVLTRTLTDIFHPLWFAMQGECHLNRETAATVVASGFTLVETSKHGGGLLQIIKAASPKPP